MRYYLYDLFTQTKDTDPDLRFMALNDLEKELISPESKFTPESREEYANTLLRCLDDEFSEVKSQALKCFETLSPRLDSYVVSVLKNLSIKKPTKPSITSSIYTMAIHNILRAIIPDDTKGHQIINSLLDPLLHDEHSFFTIIDYIEVLTDLLEYLGKYFSTTELASTANILIKASFKADAIIAKKSVAALSILSRNVYDSSQMGLILRKSLSLSDSIDTYQSKQTLLSIYSALIKANPAVVSGLFASDILPAIIKNLALDKIDSPNEDFDVQQDIDRTRSESLRCLNSAYQSLSGSAMQQFVDQTLPICAKFIVYDPYTENVEGDDEDSMDEDLSEDSYMDDSEFQEEEEEDEYGTSISWLLRQYSIQLIETIATPISIALPAIYKIFDKLIVELFDQNSLVQTQDIKTLVTLFKCTNSQGAFYSIQALNKLKSTTEGHENNDVEMLDDPLSALKSKLPILFEKFDLALAHATSTKLPLLYEFVSTLSSCIGQIDSKWIDTFLVKLNTLRDGPPTSELLKFYSSVLSNNSLDQLNTSFNIIIDNISQTLQSSNHELILESLLLLYKLLSETVPKSNVSNEMLAQLASKFNDILIKMTLNKNYSSEIRKESIMCLACLTINVTNDSQIIVKAADTFTQTIKLEFLVMSDLQCIGHLLESPKVVSVLSKDWVEQVLNSALEYTSNTELCMQSVQTISSLLKANLLNTENKQKTLAQLVKLCQSHKLDKAVVIECIQIIATILDSTELTVDESLVKILVQLSKSTQLENSILTHYIGALLKHVDADSISNALLRIGSRNDPIVSKLLAITSVCTGTAASLDDVLSNLSSGKDALFGLVFLEQASKTAPINPDLSILVKYFDDSNPEIRDAAVQATSEIVAGNAKQLLPDYLKVMKSAKGDITQLALCLSKIMESITIDGATGNFVFEAVKDVQEKLELTKKTRKECNYTADCLGSIARADQRIISNYCEILSGPHSNALKVAVASASKDLLADENFMDDQIHLLSEYVDLSTTENFIFNDNLTMKEVGVANIIAAVYKRPLIALPLVSKMLPRILETELSPKKEYIKVVRIGPFKHKLDDALEFRKQLYELVYSTLTTLETKNNMRVLFRADYSYLFKRLIIKSFKDDPTVTFLCLLIVLKIIKLRPDIFTGSELLTTFIHSCTKKLNKKLRDEAPKQEIEKRDDIVKAILRCSKKVNALVENKTVSLDGDVLSAWKAYISMLRTKYPIFEAIN